MISSRRKFIQVSLGTGTLAMTGFPVYSLPSQSQNLIKKVIPSTGEKITAIGIGTSRRYDAGDSGEERAALKAVLKGFAEKGGQLVDTAPSYGRAEPVVGDLVSEIGNRDKLFIATKVRKETKADGIKEIDQSFKLLKTDKLDLLQVHNLVGIDGILPYMRGLKKEGRIRYIGVSCSRETQHEDFIKMMEKQELDFIQINYSLGDRAAADKILPLAKERGMAVLINLPYGRGKLFQAVGDRKLPDWAEEFDAKSWGQFFLKYLISHPAVTCPIPGTAKVKYMIDNFGAAQGRLPDQDMRKRMEEFYDGL